MTGLRKLLMLCRRLSVSPDSKPYGRKSSRLNSAGPTGSNGACFLLVYTTIMRTNTKNELANAQTQLKTYRSRRPDKQ